MYVYMSVSEIGLLGVAKGQPNVPVSLDLAFWWHLYTTASTTLSKTRKD